MSDISSDYIPETLPPALPDTPPPNPPEKPPRVPPELRPSVSYEPPEPLSPGLFAALPRSRPRTPDLRPPSPYIRAPSPSIIQPSNFEDQTSSSCEVQISVTSDLQFTVSSETRQSTSSEAQSDTSFATQQNVSSETQQTASSDTQPTASSDTQPTTSSETQPTSTSETQPTSMSETQPISTSETQLPSTSGAGTSASTDSRPAASDDQPPALAPPPPPPDAPAAAAVEHTPADEVFPEDNHTDDQNAVLLRRGPSLRRKEGAPYADTTLKRVSKRVDRIGAAITRFLDRDKPPGADRDGPKSPDFLSPVPRSNEKRSDNAENKNSLIPFGSNFLRRSFRQKSSEEYEEADTALASSAGESVRNSVYNEDLVASLVCAACAHYMVAPIEQCKRGHNICKFCRRRAHQQRCPACGARLTGIRNRVAEDMARKLLFPCVHAHAGCARQVPNDELEFHEPRCPFRVYSCLINVASGVPCKWEGRRVALEEHVKSEHPRYYSAQETTKWRWSPNLLVKMEDFQLLSAFGELFWYCAAQDPERMRVCWFVQHVGYDQDSVRFEFRFALADESDRRLDFRCTTLPDYSTAGSIVESGHCVDLSYQQVLSFVDDEGTMKFSVTVHQVDAQNGSGC